MWNLNEPEVTKREDLIDSSMCLNKEGINTLNKHTTVKVRDISLLLESREKENIFIIECNDDIDRSIQRFESNLITKKSTDMHSNTIKIKPCSYSTK